MTTAAASAIPVPPPSGPALRGAARTLQDASGRIAAAGGKHIGDLISWNGEGVDVERSQVKAAFATIDMESLVPTIAPAAALTRAVSETRRPEHLRVTQFLRRNDDTPVSYGVYRITGTGEKGDAYDCGARVRVDMTTDLVVATPPEGGVVIDECMVLAEQIAARANHLVNHAETRDIGVALVAVAKRLAGVSLRNRGGFYLLPPASCDKWLRLKPEIERFGMEPIRIEMHDAPDNVAVAAKAAEGALEADIKELLEDLAKASSPEGMRAHAIERRVRLCSELKAKAELFRGVLEGTVDQIKRRVSGLSQAFQDALAAKEGGVAMPQSPAEKLGLFDAPPIVDDEPEGE